MLGNNAKVCGLKTYPFIDRSAKKIIKGNKSITGFTGNLNLQYMILRLTLVY